MRKFLDTIADAYFVSHPDGTVRFALVRPKSAYAALSEPEVEALRPLWRSLVRCHVIAAHLFVIVGFFAPWVGFSLLLAQWLGGGFLLADLGKKWAAKVGHESDYFANVYVQLSQYISRGKAAALGVAALLAAVPGAAQADRLLWLIFPEVEVWFACFFILAVRWAIFFFGIALSPKRDTTENAAVAP